MTRPKSASSNEGIQATNVSAEVLAVGRNAKAVKVIDGANRAELIDAISKLEQALNGLKLPDQVRQTVQNDISKLTSAAQEKDPGVHAGGILKRITSGLKSAGVAVKETAALIEPITKIAGVLHLGLAALGLG